MPHLYRATTGQSICALSDVQLQQLKSALVEESAEDTEYFLDEDTLEYMAEQGVDPSLIQLLQAAIAEDGSLDVTWDA
ncbi:MAG: galactosyldiacylglycerol synthase [Dehalococcoidia bacterium]|nr:galactosyldiacylglycerol synthase [Dehalococcoidia bacterium]